MAYRTAVYTVELRYSTKDGCGNAVEPPSEGEIRLALDKAFPNCTTSVEPLYNTED